MPLPASRRLSVVLGISVLLILFTAFMDAALWGLFNAPIEHRRQAARVYELQALRNSHRQLAREAHQLRQQVDMLSSALHSCVDREASALEVSEPESEISPRFATPCLADELSVQADEGGPTLCVPSSENGLSLEDRVE